MTDRSIEQKNFAESVAAIPVMIVFGFAVTGVAGYFVGAAIGFAGASAVVVGGSLIVAGLAVVGAVGLGVYGIAVGIMYAVEKNQQKKLQQEMNNKPELTVEGSTKQILQASPQVEQTNELPKNPDAVPLLQNTKPEATKPSFISIIFGIFKRNTQNTAVPTTAEPSPQPK